MAGHLCSGVAEVIENRRAEEGLANVTLTDRKSLLMNEVNLE